MQKGLDASHILMYLNHHKGNLIVAERFTKILIGEIHKTVTVCNIFSYMIL